MTKLVPGDAGFADLFVTPAGGYIPGMDRSPEGDRLVTHLYRGTFADPGYPMCPRGWNRDGGTSYSIWRNQVSARGICKVCARRARAGLAAVPARLDVRDAAFWALAGDPVDSAPSAHEAAVRRWLTR